MSDDDLDHLEEHGPNHDEHVHAAPPAGFDSAFALGAALNTAFIIVEISYGLVANSVALLADAAHNVGDVLGLLLAWGATWLGRRKPTAKRSYGFGRSSILASLTNGAVLLVGVGGIVVESVQRLITPDPTHVQGLTVMAVASIGILVNGGTALLFAHGRKGDLNVKGAFLHMAADAAVSAGVVLSGLVIIMTGWGWVDPIVSLGIAAVILVSTWGLLRDSASMALDHVPPSIDVEQVFAYLAGLDGVAEVHDLHVWALSTTDTALTAHLVRPAAGTDDDFLSEARDTLRTKFGIGHVTLQVEAGGHCPLAPADIVSALDLKPTATATRWS